MTQILNLPINDCILTASYKSEVYKVQWGFNHYGMDCVSKSGVTNISSPGDGIIVAYGMDGATDKDRLGNCIVAVFENVMLSNGQISSVAIRMFHLDKILVKAGEKITKGQIIAKYGNTGKYTSGAHLHVETDTDVQYPAYAFGISSSGKVIARGTLDSTINPAKVFKVGVNQSISSNNSSIASGWVALDDITSINTKITLPELPNILLPTAPTNDKLNSKLAEVTAQKDKLQGKLDEIIKIVTQ